MPGNDYQRKLSAVWLRRLRRKHESIRHCQQVRPASARHSRPNPCHQVSRQQVAFFPRFSQPLQPGVGFKVRNFRRRQGVLIIRRLFIQRRQGLRGFIQRRAMRAGREFQTSRVESPLAGFPREASRFRKPGNCLSSQLFSSNSANFKA